MAIFWDESRLKLDVESIARCLPALVASVLAACSTVPGGEAVRPPAPSVISPTMPTPPAPPLSDAPARAAKPPKPSVIEPTKTPPPQAVYLDAVSGAARIARFLPEGIADRHGWAKDIFAPFASLKLPLSAENICAVAAVIAQESSFQGDPVVAGLPKIVKRELERRRQSIGAPQWLMDRALEIASPNGRSYRYRIDRLKTEAEVSRLYDDMISELPLGKRLLADYNPVRTGGPMQVSLEFAKAQIKEAAYPYAYAGSLRNELFTRRGGVYFGVAYLLHYPAEYDAMLYRFADFNAGRYASRNAAFQQALHLLSGVALDYDGDLSIYRDGAPSDAMSRTRQVLYGLAQRLSLSREQIARDLLLEKKPEFSRTPLYRQVFALAERSTGRVLERARLPEIKLKGPKITRQLTTAWFAQRVDGRRRECMKIEAAALPSATP